MKNETKWGSVQKEQRSELRGLISFGPGGLKCSAEIVITGFGGRSFRLDMTLPGGRSFKRHGIHSLQEAKDEAQRVADALLPLSAELPESERARLGVKP